MAFIHSMAFPKRNVHESWLRGYTLNILPGSAQLLKQKCRLRQGRSQAVKTEEANVPQAHK